jgi:hypothetical protein
MLSITVQLALILRLPVPSQICWALVAAAGAAPVLSYAALAEYFPKQVAGRASGALGVVDIGGAFVLQYTTGLLIQQWPGLGGHYPAAAYQAAFAVNVALEHVALAWFLLPDARERISVFAGELLTHSVRHPSLPNANSLYDAGVQIWAARMVGSWQEKNKLAVRCVRVDHCGFPARNGISDVGGASHCDCLCSGGRNLTGGCHCQIRL